MAHSQLEIENACLALAEMSNMPVLSSSNNTAYSHSNTWDGRVSAPADPPPYPPGAMNLQLTDSEYDDLQCPSCQRRWRWNEGSHSCMDHMVVADLGALEKRIIDHTRWSMDLTRWFKDNIDSILLTRHRQLELNLDDDTREALDGLMRQLQDHLEEKMGQQVQAFREEVNNAFLVEKTELTALVFTVNKTATETLSKLSESLNTQIAELKLANLKLQERLDKVVQDQEKGLW